MCSFYSRTDPKRAKNMVKPSIFFALLGSALVKAVHKMLMKWTLGGQIAGVGVYRAGRGGPLRRWFSIFVFALKNVLGWRQPLILPTTTDKASQADKGARDRLKCDLKELLLKKREAKINNNKMWKWIGRSKTRRPA